MSNVERVVSMSVRPCDVGTTQKLHREQKLILFLCHFLSVALKGGGAASDATKMGNTYLESGKKATRFYIKRQNSSSLANYIFGSRKKGLFTIACI